MGIPAALTRTSHLKSAVEPEREVVQDGNMKGVRLRVWDPRI
jgi:hypothetical protein